MDVGDWLAKIGSFGAMILPALIMLAFWGLLITRRIRRRLREMRQHEAAGTIGRASFFQGGDMPIHYDLVAHIGTGGPAATTVGEQVLRPSIGVKLVILGVAGMILYYTTQHAFWQTDFGGLDDGSGWIFSAARVLLPISALYGVLYIFTNEARYDRDVLIVTRLMLYRREYRWKNLTRIGDGGAYDLVLFFKPGGKAKVLKHSAGIAEFKAFALGQVQKNRPNMPELPEVETVRRGLLPVMEGQVIARAEVNRPDLRWPLPAGMADRLTGKRVAALRRRSKYILADLDSGETLLVHLGMSGRVLISGAQLGSFYHDHPAPQKHDHIVLHMESGARVTFNDARRFGAMDLMATEGAEAHTLLAGLGPEPLGNDFNGPTLAARLKGRRTPIKSALLDQGIVAGLGNIYVAETLYRARISPLRLAGDVTTAEAQALVPVIRDVLSEAIEAGGSSLRDFRQANGELGYFSKHFQVYDREGQPCETQGCTGTITRVVQSGRSSFFCPACQR